MSSLTVIKMDSEIASTLEAFVLDKMAETKLPALSFAIIENGTVTHQRSLGFRDIERRLPATPQTLFGIGSVTKVFTAVAIMQLQDRGHLQVDDPVSKYLDLDLQPFGEPIRIRHFLSHTSGIPALGLAESKHSDRWFMTGLPVADGQDVLTFMQGAEDWAHDKPGQRWFYLNEGFILLGLIIEQVSGQSYADYVTEHILEPLGMHRSYFDRELVEREADVATPYMLDNDGRPFVGTNLYSQIPAAGGLVSNTEDMARFTSMFLNGGLTADATRIISQEALQAMMEPRIALPPVKADLGFPACGDDAEYPGSWGYGLVIHRDFFGHEMAGHGGGVMGASAYMAFIPDRKIGVALQANGHGYPLGQLAVYALAAMLGEDPEQLTFQRRERLLDELQGPYESFRDTMRAEVTRNGDLLELRILLHPVNRVVPLIPLDLDEQAPRFFTFVGGRRISVEFSRSAEGVELVYERYKFRKTLQRIGDITN